MALSIPLNTKKTFKQIYFTHRWDLNRYYNYESVDLGVMVMKGYFTFPRSPKLELYYQKQLGITPRTPLFLRESYPSVGDTVKHIQNLIPNGIDQIREKSTQVDFFRRIKII